MTGRDSETNELNRIERRSVLRAGIAGALATGGVGALAGTAAAETLVVDDNGNADHSTIQAAIDAANSGDTVQVRPGTYEENVVIDVLDLTLTGDGNAVVQGRDGRNAAVSIASNGVTVENLRVENPGGLLGIKAQSGLSGVTIRSNRVSNVGPFGDLGVSGIISAGGQSNLAIVGNTVSGLRGEASGVAAQGIFLDNQGGTSAQARVAGNTVSNVRSAYGAIGILLQVAEPTVENNHVRGLNGDVFAQGLNFSKDSGSTRAAFNTFENVSGGKYPGEGVKIDSADVSSLTVTRNNLLPPVGLNNAVGTTVDAKCNYWDSPSGPSPVGDGSEVISPDNVDFRPWSVGRIGGGSGGNTCRGGQ